MSDIKGPRPYCTGFPLHTEADAARIAEARAALLLSTPPPPAEPFGDSSSSPASPPPRLSPEQLPRPPTPANSTFDHQFPSALSAVQRRALRGYVSPREGRPLTPQETETRRIAYALKEAEPDPEALRVAADEMAELVPPHAELVPVPSSSGDLAANRCLAAAIAGRVGGRVVEALARRAPVESSRLRRLRGDPPLSLDEHGLEPTEAAASLQGEPVFIDNVTISGHTFGAAYLALGRRGFGVAFAIAANFLPYPTGDASGHHVRDALAVPSISAPPTPRPGRFEAFSPEWLEDLARRHPPAPVQPQPTLRRVGDDQLLNALDAFATALLTTADLPADITVFSFDDLLEELNLRGLLVRKPRRLMVLAGEAERLALRASREASAPDPEPVAVQLQEQLETVRVKISSRLTRMLRRQPPDE